MWSECLLRRDAVWMSLWKLSGLSGQTLPLGRVQLSYEDTCSESIAQSLLVPVLYPTSSPSQLTRPGAYCHSADRYVRSVVHMPPKSKKLKRDDQGPHVAPAAQDSPAKDLTGPARRRVRGRQGGLKDMMNMPSMF